MSGDLALRWDEAAGRYDLALDDLGGPARDTSLRTAVLASIFTWGRAREGDPLPGFADNPRGGDRKGYWGDAFAAVPGRQAGSRVWLLARRVITPATLRDAKVYLEDCLAWTVADGLATRVDVAVWREGATTIRARVEVFEADGTVTTIPNLAIAGG